MAEEEQHQFEAQLTAEHLAGEIGEMGDKPIAVQATRPVWALISVLTTVILFGGATWLHYMQSQEDALAASVGQLNEGAKSDGNRLTRIETQMDELRRQGSDARQAQERIEGKLDRLIENGASAHR